MGCGSGAARIVRSGECADVLNMHTLISKHQIAIADICVRFGVKKLEVFGSAARASDFDPAHSDADFLVEFGLRRNFSPLEEYFGLRDALADLLGRPVDLIEPKAVRNPFVQKQINASREIVYNA
jgi:uncharacterized protein